MLDGLAPYFGSEEDSIWTIHTLVFVRNQNSRNSTMVSYRQVLPVGAMFLVVTAEGLLLGTDLCAIQTDKSRPDSLRLNPTKLYH